MKFGASLLLARQLGSLALHSSLTTLIFSTHTPNMAKSMGAKAGAKKRKHGRRKKAEKTQPKMRISKGAREDWERHLQQMAEEETLRRRLINDFWARNKRPKRVGILDLRLGSSKPGRLHEHSSCVISDQL